jgi:hypothetical protein
MPILLGVAPFGVIYGVVALQSGIPPLAAMAMSSIVFAGSAQFLLAQLVGAGAPLLLSAGAVGLVNLRHALYSASVAPMLAHLPRRWKILLAYLLTDEAYAAAIPHLMAAKPGSPQSVARALDTVRLRLRPVGRLAGGDAGRGADRRTTAVGSRAGFCAAADLHCHRGADDLKAAALLAVRADRRRRAVALAALPYKMGLFLAALAGLVVGAAC